MTPRSSCPHRGGGFGWACPEPWMPCLVLASVAPGKLGGELFFTTILKPKQVTHRRQASLGCEVSVVGPDTRCLRCRGQGQFSSHFKDEGGIGYSLTKGSQKDCSGQGAGSSRGSDADPQGPGRVTQQWVLTTGPLPPVPTNPGEGVGMARLSPSPGVVFWQRLGSEGEEPSAQKAPHAAVRQCGAQGRGLRR